MLKFGICAKNIEYCTLKKGILKLIKSKFKAFPPNYYSFGNLIYIPLYFLDF